MYIRKNPNGTINTNMKGKTNAVIKELKAKLDQCPLKLGMVGGT